MKNCVLFILYLVSIEHFKESNGEVISLSREELEAVVNKIVEVRVKKEVDAQIQAKLLSGELVARNTCCKQDVVSAPVRRELQRKRFVANSEFPIGFTACVSVPDLLNLGDQNTIIFDKVITNTGSAYHPHTGIFIAPSKGLYVFHLTAMSSPGNEQYLAFIHDGTIINHAYPDARGSQGYETTGSHWVMELDKGSEVWVRSYGAGQIHGNCFTVFSGFLLYQTE